MKKIVIGVTGGIASGKTSVMRLLRQNGIRTISSDDLSHRCIRKGSLAYRAVLKQFGAGILGKRREIDRSKLGKIVFSDSKQRRKLERIIHPCVIKEIQRLIRYHQGLIAVDIPLLFEARLTPLVDRTLVVYCSPREQLRRLMKRSRLSSLEARQRINAQMPLSKKRALADDVLSNEGPLSALRGKVSQYLLNLKNA